MKHCNFINFEHNASISNHRNLPLPPYMPFNSDSAAKTNGGNIEVQDRSPDDVGKTLTLAGQQHARA
jgi:hypothetical protein